MSDFEEVHNFSDGMKWYLGLSLSMVLLVVVSAVAFIVFRGDSFFDPNRNTLLVSESTLVEDGSVLGILAFGQNPIVSQTANNTVRQGSNIPKDLEDIQKLPPFPEGFEITKVVEVNTASTRTVTIYYDLNMEIEKFIPLLEEYYSSRPIEDLDIKGATVFGRFDDDKFYLDVNRLSTNEVEATFRYEFRDIQY